MKRLIGLVLVLSLIASGGIFGCQKVSGTKIAAIVNGKKITLKDLDKEFKKISKRYQAQPQIGLGKEQESRMKKQILIGLMEEILLEQEAKKAGIKVTEKQINERYKQFQVGRSKKEFQEQLKKAGLTEKDLKEQIKTQLLQEKLRKKAAKAKKPSEKEIKAYYKKNKSQFTGAEGKVMSYKEVKSRIEQLLTSQKEQEAWSEWLDGIKAKSKVRIYFW